MAERLPQSFRPAATSHSSPLVAGLTTLTLNSWPAQLATVPNFLHQANRRSPNILDSMRRKSSICGCDDAQRRPWT